MFGVMSEGDEIEGVAGDTEAETGPGGGRLRTGMSSMVSSVDRPSRRAFFNADIS